MRRAALLAAEANEEGRIEVRPPELEAALDELQQDGERLTATLLGREERPAPSPNREAPDIQVIR